MDIQTVVAFIGAFAAVQALFIPANYLLISSMVKHEVGKAERRLESKINTKLEEMGVTVRKTYNN